MKYTEKDLREYLADRRETMSDALYEIKYPIPLKGSLLDEDHADLQVTAWLQQARTNLNAAIDNLQAIEGYLQRKENQEI